jgi:hydroxymethylpyrimidine kinase/phosphomethylpyrimidine kinase
MTLWLIGGLDPTGGAGVTRDRATAEIVAPELPLSVVVTAQTEQGDGRVARARPRSPQLLARELAALPPPRAVKLGLVPDSVVDTVLAAVRPWSCAIVLDPVLQASDGGVLGSSVAGLLRLAAAATLVTPNRGEALALAATTSRDADVLLEQLAVALAPAAVLLKDGHGDDPLRVCDRLWERAAVHRFARARQPGPDPRGTGCALATAIACALARGATMAAACGQAIAWLDDARKHSVTGPDGRPHLPARG